MILWMWTKHIDPDNSAIPYLTALGDLLGTALLAIAFIVLFSIGDKDSDVGDWDAVTVTFTVIVIHVLHLLFFHINLIQFTIILGFTSLNVSYIL